MKKIGKKEVLYLLIAVAFLFALTLQTIPIDASPPTDPTYEELAAYWAPVISQDIDADKTRAEYITRFDYDDNWCGNDNWDNLYDYDLPAYVYYWVIETETHYFIGYAFFHPRDWSSATPGYVSRWIEHENDLEGILLTIQKSSDSTYRYGKFVSMVTVAHSDFWSYTEQDTPSSSDWYNLVAPSHSVTDGYEDIDADIDFVVDNFGFHPVVFVQSEGHGVFGYQSGRRGSTSGATYHVTDWAPIFDDNGVTDWRGANWMGIVDLPVSGDPSDTYGTSGWGDGIIYHYENSANDPTSHGNPKDWEVVGYDLLSISELWDRRYDYESCKVTFDHYGTFDGNDGEHDGANAPWGWNDGDDGPVYRPDFFMHPAYLIDYYFDGLGTFSRTYIGSSFTEEREYVIETTQPLQGDIERWDVWGWKWYVKMEDADEVDIHIDRLSICDNGIFTVKNGRDLSEIVGYRRRMDGVDVDVRGRTVHACTNYLIIEVSNLDNGDWGFSIRIECNSPPRLGEIRPIEIDEGPYLNIRDYVDVVDPEGGSIEYEIRWDPDTEESRGPWLDGPYEGSLTVGFTDEDSNSDNTDVQITVHNVPPTPSVEFEEVELVFVPRLGLVELVPEEHNIYISTDDPGEFDNPWNITVNFGDGSSQRVQSDSGEETLRNPYERGIYTVTVDVEDKDGGRGSVQREFVILYNETEARLRNIASRSAAEEFKKHIIIMAQVEELKRMLRILEAGKATEGLKIPEWLDGDPDPDWAKDILDGRIVAHITMSDGSILTLKMVLEKGNLKEIDQINEDEVKSFNPSAKIYADGKAVVDIIQSDNPAIALKLAFEQGEISIKGVDIGSKVKYGFAGISGRIGAKFVESPYNIKQGKVKEITFEGQKATLKRSSLGYRVVEVGGEALAMIIDERGVVRGGTTWGIQKLIEEDPTGLSPNAGIIGGAMK